MSDTTEYIETEDTLHTANYAESEDTLHVAAHAESEDTLHVANYGENETANNVSVTESEDKTARGEAWDLNEEDADHAIEGNHTVGGDHHVRGNGHYEKDLAVDGVLYAPVIVSRMLNRWRDYSVGEGTAYPLSALLGYELYMRTNSNDTLLNTLASTIGTKVDTATFEAALNALRADLSAGLSNVQPSLTGYLPLSGGTLTGPLTATQFNGPLFGNASTASKLYGQPLLWGQRFYGDNDIIGALSNVTDINMSGAIKIGNAILRYVEENGIKAIRLSHAITGETIGFFSDGWISAKGANANVSGGGGGSFDLMINWNDPEHANRALQGSLGNELRAAIQALQTNSSSYLTGISKQMVEAVLTGNITSHFHNQYLTEHQSLADYATIATMNQSLSSYLPLTGGTLTGDVWMDGCNLRIGDALLMWDSDAKAVRVTNANTGEVVGLYSDGWMSAKGANASGGGGGFDLMTSWDAEDTDSKALQGTLALWLKQQVDNLSGALTSVPEATSSSYGGVKLGYAQTGKNYPVQLSGGKAYVNVPWTDHYAWSDITSKPTTIGGYGITNAYTKTESDNRYKISNGVITLGSNTITPLTSHQDISGKADKDLKNAVGSLSEATGTVTDGTHILTSYASDNGYSDTNAQNVTYKRPASKLYAYIKGKTDTLYPTKTGGGASGSWAISVTGNAGTATKLATARSLWGNSFDGSADVSGNITVTQTGTSSATVKVQNDSRSVSIDATDNRGLYDNTGGNWMIMRPYGTTHTVLGETGNIGIATTAPTEKLHVAGNIKTSGNILPTATNASDLGTADLRWKYIYLYNGVKFSDFNINRANGVGIATAGWYRIGSIPNGSGYSRICIRRDWNQSKGESYIFDVATTHYNSSKKPMITQVVGNFAIHLISKIRIVYPTNASSPTYYVEIYYTDAINNTVYVAGEGSFTASSPTSVSATVASEYTSVEFNTTDGISNNSNILSTGAITAKASSSDERLKEDISDYDALALIDKVDAVSFKWNETAKQNSEVFDTDETQYGFIAQQLQAAGLGQFVKDYFGDYLTVDYERFVPIAIKGIQEQQKKISELEEDLRLIKQKLGL